MGTGYFENKICKVGFHVMEKIVGVRVFFSELGKNLERTCRCKKIKYLLPAKYLGF